MDRPAPGQGQQDGDDRQDEDGVADDIHAEQPLPDGPLASIPQPEKGDEQGQGRARER